MTDKEYRVLKDRMSFSYVKDFAKDRIAFYKKHIIGDKSSDEEMSTAMKLGTVVDCLLFSPNEFDDRISVAACLAPTGQIGEFTENLINLTIQSLDENNKVTREFNELMEEAFTKTKYNKKGEEVKFKGKDFAYLLKNFVGTGAENYYKICRSQFGKIVVDMNLISAAEKTKEELETCEWTKDIILAKTEENIEVIDQLPLLFDIHIGIAQISVPFKGMPDRVIINHSTEEVSLGFLIIPPKSIIPYDLKISYTGEDFEYQYWKMKYYLQIASYYLGLEHYKKVVRPELKDYDIPSIEFIVGSSTLQSNPLLFSTTPINVNEGLYGFTDKYGKKHKGLYELVSEILWHKKEGLWRNSKEVYDRKGKMIIKPFEEEE